MTVFTSTVWSADAGHYDADRVEVGQNNADCDYAIVAVMLVVRMLIVVMLVVVMLILVMLVVVVVVL